jgi:hypothetical protein
MTAPIHPPSRTARDPYALRGSGRRQPPAERMGRRTIGATGGRSAATAQAAAQAVAPPGAGGDNVDRADALRLTGSGAKILT